MARPTEQIAACAGAHARLNQLIAGLSDADARSDLLLPGWSIGHLLTHLARNADSVVRRLEAATRNEIVDQYAGGASARASDIELGARRSAAALVEDLSAASAAVDAAFASSTTSSGNAPAATAVA